MGKNQLDGDRREFCGGVKEQPGRLSNDDLMIFDSSHNRLAGRLQGRYGHERARAECQVRAWNARRHHNI